MFKSFFWCSDRVWSQSVRWRLLYAYGGTASLVILLLTQVGLALWFNLWNATFLDTLAHAAERPEDALWRALRMFALIALADIMVHTITGYVKRIYALWWRTAITEKYVPEWQEKPQTSDNLKHVSQRIQESTGELARLSENLAWEFARAVGMVFAFIPVLWYLSSYVTAGPLAWSGSFAVIACIAGAGGFIGSWVVGCRQTGLQIENQHAESEFRDRMTLAERSPVELKRLDWRRFFGDVTRNCRHLYLHYGYFDAWNLTYGKIVMILPYALCIPHMPSDMISFPVMLMIVSAFGQVMAGFSAPINKWQDIARWRSVRARLCELEAEFKKVRRPQLELDSRHRGSGVQHVVVHH